MLIHVSKTVLWRYYYYPHPLTRARSLNMWVYASHGTNNNIYQNRNMKQMRQKNRKHPTFCKLIKCVECTSDTKYHSNALVSRGQCRHLLRHWSMTKAMGLVWLCDNLAGRTSAGRVIKRDIDQVLCIRNWRTESCVCYVKAASDMETSNGSWCMGIKGEMSGTVCVTFTWDMYIYIYIYMSCL